MEVELNGVLKANEIGGNVSQPKDLPRRKLSKIGENGNRSLPMVANPGEGKKCHTTMIPAEMPLCGVESYVASSTILP